MHLLKWNIKRQISSIILIVQQKRLKAQMWVEKGVPAELLSKRDHIIYRVCAEARKYNRPRRVADSLSPDTHHPVAA